MTIMLLHIKQSEEEEHPDTLIPRIACNFHACMFANSVCKNDAGKRLLNSVYVKK